MRFDDNLNLTYHRVQEFKNNT